MGMFDQMKEAMKMRSEAKRIQSEIQKIRAEYSNGGITAVAKGDMTIEKIAVSPEAYDEVKAGKPARFETMLLNVVNGALKKSKDATQAEMAKLMQQGGGGIGGLFGK
ncbi:MAG: YbaB/EbfC family nucleoid-associated protein [Kiritimatiellae bacterium]|nr:YbaB/EbfC family nucleoid-associated protein [Kiritimatiellia bacterium]